MGKINELTEIVFHIQWFIIEFNITHPLQRHAPQQLLYRRGVYLKKKKNENWQNIMSNECLVSKVFLCRYMYII